MYLKYRRSRHDEQNMSILYDKDGFGDVSVQIGVEEQLPHVPTVSPRFRLRIFHEWAVGPPDRRDQVAQAYLAHNGLDKEHLKVLRSIPGVKLSKPRAFYDRFGGIDPDKPRGTLPNTVYNYLFQRWICESGTIDPQRLRGVAALMLQQNGYTTEQIAHVLGWQARGSATRAMQSAREALQQFTELN